MLKLALLLLIAGSSWAAALPESFHVAYEVAGRDTVKLDVSYENGHAVRTVERGGKKTVTDPFDGAAALWDEVDTAKLFTWKPEVGPGAPDFGARRLAAESTDHGTKQATAQAWNAPLKNDGAVWSLLNHLDTLMNGAPQDPLTPASGAPATPAAPANSAPASPHTSPGGLPAPTEPKFAPAPPASPAAAPAPPLRGLVRALGAPPMREMVAPASSPADRVRALVAERAERAARADRAALPPGARDAAPGASVQVNVIQPGAVEATIASVATNLPLALTPWEPAADPLTAQALDRARRPVYEAARARLDAMIAQRPRSAERLSLRAAVEVQLGDLAGALADFSRAVALQPHKGDHRHNRGVIHARLGHFDEARRDLEAAHRLTPARFEPAPLVLAGADERSWLGRPGRHLRAPREDLR